MDSGYAYDLIFKKSTIFDINNTREPEAWCNNFILLFNTQNLNIFSELWAHSHYADVKFGFIMRIKTMLSIFTDFKTKIPVQKVKHCLSIIVLILIVKKEYTIL